MNGERIPTGVRRLDDLLQGGVPKGSFALVYGPPFIGKEVLARLFFSRGWSDDMPSIMVLTNSAAGDLRGRLHERYNSAYSHFEEGGYAHFIDAYSPAIGAAEPHDAVSYVDSLMDFNAISAAVNDTQAKILGKNDGHRLVFDSISTLVAHANTQTAFRFLQVFIGRAKRAGASGIILMDEGMHTEADVRMFRHLTDGVIEVREEANKYLLRVEGLGSHTSHGWVEYRFDDDSIEIVGSFSAGRIR